MVQRTAPHKPKPPAELKKGHGGLDRHFSSHLHQDTRSRAGADHRKKKPKKVRSMKISDFDRFEHSPMDFRFKKASLNPVRNYMKPTSSSDARKGKLQVTVTPHVITDKNKSPRSSKNLNSLKASSCSLALSASPKAVKVLSRQPSLKPVRSSMKKSSTVSLCAKKNLNRATCSSTLKDSKFPAALVLDHGATEAEGVSKMRVCPYTYCSLNGHMHQTMPPLKCFISAKRKSLKTQRSMEITGLFSVNDTIENEEEKNNTEQDVFSKNSSDLFVEIYDIPQKEVIGEENCEEICIQEGRDQEQDCMFDEVEDSSETMSLLHELSDISFEYEYEYDMDQTSELSQDELDDVMMNFYEYVEIDDEEKAQEDYEFEQDRDPKDADIEAIDMDWEEEQIFSNTVALKEEEEEEADSESKEINSHATRNDESNRSFNLNPQPIFEKFPKNPQEGIGTILARACEHDDAAVDVIILPEMKNFQSLGVESNRLEKELLEAINGTAGTVLNASGIDFKETCDFLSSSSRWNVTRKRTSEELEQAKEFNPRQPNFLPLEPDPDAEKVDLRHQTMDGRKNAEDWMVDYALQQAVAKLGGATRKRKVALLVEAFETVVPPHACEKPLSHVTSAFAHPGFIQACN